MKPFFLLCFLVLGVAAIPARGFLQYPRSSLWDLTLLNDDPFRVLEHNPFPVARSLENLALARADWKETSESHVISIDVPGVSKRDIKIEVEENRILRISGEREVVEVKEKEGEKWHRSERTSGKFWRQFRLPAGADMDNIRAHLEDGVLRITIPKLAEETTQPKVVEIVDHPKGEDIKASKADQK